MTVKEIIAGYLADNDYKSIEEWAEDSDYSWDKNDLLWRDESGNEVDIEECLYYTLEAAYLAAHEL